MTSNATHINTVVEVFFFTLEPIMSPIGDFLEHHPGSFAIITAVLALLLYCVTKFYLNRQNFPPGPFPLPVLGNIFMFKGVKKHLHDCFLDIGKNYKNGVYTFYLGPMPQVVVTNPALALEALSKHHFAGRPKIPGIETSFVTPDSIDVFLADFGKEWEVLRKVAHSAVRKYAVSDKLPQVVSDVTDEMVHRIKSKEGIGNEIDINSYLTLGVYSILSTAAFGKKYNFEDAELLRWIEVSENHKKDSTKVFLIVFIPGMKYIFREKAMRLFENSQYKKQMLISNYETHLETFDKKVIRDFTDAMICAKVEAEEEEEESQRREVTRKYLKPANLQNTINDLFAAGSDTTRNTLLWAFLLMATYPEMQQRIREEIHTVIGPEDIPTLSHKPNCNYTTAFISEVLRWISGSALPHKATVDTELGGLKIKKDTPVLVIMKATTHDENTWENPHVFNPNRFLDESGHDFVSKPNQFYIPFSTGRRGCPGQNMALSDIFFIIARFMQQTEGLQICLPGGPGSVDINGDINQTMMFAPHDFRIVLKPISI